MITSQNKNHDVLLSKVLLLSICLFIISMNKEKGNANETFRKWVSRSTSKYTNDEKNIIKTIIATLTLKRFPDDEIIKEIFDKTNKTISRKQIYNVRQQIKKESYDWYKTMREGQYEYIHEFKERINEIIALQKMHHEIIDNDKEPTQVKQTSLVELHSLV